MQAEEAGLHMPISPFNLSNLIYTFPCPRQRMIEGQARPGMFQQESLPFLCKKLSLVRKKHFLLVPAHSSSSPKKKNPLIFHTSCPQRVSAARQTQTKPVPKRSLEVAVTKVCYLETQLHLPIDMHERQLLFPQKGGIQYNYLPWLLCLCHTTILGSVLYINFHFQTTTWHFTTLLNFVSWRTTTILQAV